MGPVRFGFLALKPNQTIIYNKNQTKLLKFYEAILTEPFKPSRLKKV